MLGPLMQLERRNQLDHYHFHLLDLGMDHFEIRHWEGIHRHFYISQLTQLFCAEVQHDLREKKTPGTVSDGRAGSASRKRLDYSTTLGAFGTIELFSQNHRGDNVLSPA